MGIYLQNSFKVDETFTILQNILESVFHQQKRLERLVAPVLLTNEIVPCENIIMLKTTVLVLGYLTSFSQCHLITEYSRKFSIVK